MAPLTWSEPAIFCGFFARILFRRFFSLCLKDFLCYSKIFCVRSKRNYSLVLNLHIWAKYIGWLRGLSHQFHRKKVKYMTLDQGTLAALHTLCKSRCNSCLFQCCFPPPPFLFLFLYSFHISPLLKVHKNENLLAPILKFVLFHIYLCINIKVL